MLCSMPQSLSTHAYLGGILRRVQCPAISIGGTADHVHAFFQLARTQNVAKVVEILKSNSSQWLKSQGISAFPGNVAMVVSRSDNPRQRPWCNTLPAKPSIIERSVSNFEKSCVSTGSPSTSVIYGTNGSPGICRAFSAALLWGTFPRPRKLSLG